MKLTTKGCYGMRAMVELAQLYGGGPVLMRAIAERQALSRKYLHALLTSLRGAGLVRSVRGSGGGYVLARPPDQIKISEIIGALEGSLVFADCVTDHSICERANECASRDLWSQMSRVVVQVLSSVTLADLIARMADKDSPTAMYYI